MGAAVYMTLCVSTLLYGAGSRHLGAFNITSVQCILELTWQDYTQTSCTLLDH